MVMKRISELEAEKAGLDKEYSAKYKELREIEKHMSVMKQYMEKQGYKDKRGYKIWEEEGRTGEVNSIDKMPEIAYFFCSERTGETCEAFSPEGS